MTKDGSVRLCVSLYPHQAEVLDAIAREHGWLWHGAPNRSRAIQHLAELAGRLSMSESTTSVQSSTLPERPPADGESFEDLV